MSDLAIIVAPIFELANCCERNWPEVIEIQVNRFLAGAGCGIDLSLALAQNVGNVGQGPLTGI